MHDIVEHIESILLGINFLFFIFVFIFSVFCFYFVFHLFIWIEYPDEILYQDQVMLKTGPPRFTESILNSIAKYSHPRYFLIYEGWFQRKKTTIFIHSFVYSLFINLISGFDEETGIPLVISNFYRFKTYGQLFNLEVPTQNGIYFVILLLLFFINRGVLILGLWFIFMLYFRRKVVFWKNQGWKK